MQLFGSLPREHTIRREHTLLMHNILSVISRGYAHFSGYEMFVFVQAPVGSRSGLNSNATSAKSKDSLSRLKPGSETGKRDSDSIPARKSHETQLFELIWQKKHKNKFILQERNDPGRLELSSFILRW